MFNIPLINQTLIEPISRGAEELLIVSGYATPTMASWHMTKIKELSMPLIGIKLIVGMTNYDGLTKDVHEGFKQLVYAQSNTALSKFQCQYICQEPPVHSKLYIWMKMVSLLKLIQVLRIIHRLDSVWEDVNILFLQCI